MRSFLTTLICLAGCSADPGLLIGTGEIEFENVENGANMPIIQGPQGGFHLLTSLLVRGVEPGTREDLDDPNNPTITLDVLHGGDSVILIDPFTQGLEQAPADQQPWTHQITGRFAILDISNDDQLDGETVTVSARINDINDVNVSDSVEVELFPHPDNNSDF